MAIWYRRSVWMAMRLTGISAAQCLSMRYTERLGEAGASPHAVEARVRRSLRGFRHLVRQRWHALCGWSAVLTADRGDGVEGSSEQVV
jgi:hypothetical protein